MDTLLKQRILQVLYRFVVLSQVENELEALVFLLVYLHANQNNRIRILYYPVLLFPDLLRINLLANNQIWYTKVFPHILMVEQYLFWLIDCLAAFFEQ